ncbi:MAG: T9SS type A sorting domain-containing protein [Bacteroidetes bacterium]|nr:T9SS type A sorting domain-containing protein [Bacteroidota bacterium]
MTLDSVTNIYGISFVLSNGTVPWATIATFDSVKACFQRNDFGKASLFAADLGHYVADGHQPFHITKNYDGQSTGQNGIHSRYESHMIGTYSSSIVYPDDTAQFISDVPGYIFTYLYYNYQYIDSVLLADQYAQSVAGNTNSTAYYQALWTRTGAFTTELFRRASYSLSSLIYTAWVQAGKPDGISVLSPDPPTLGLNVPNPFSGRTTIPLQINLNNQKVILKVYDSAGKIVATLVDGRMNKGTHQVTWDASGYPAGVYYYVLHSGDSALSRKMILVK